MQFVHLNLFMKPVVVIGAGMAGLQAATQLHLNQIPFLLVDTQNQVGGRIQSENVKGFTLDFGFQVLQTNYPEVQRSLDLSALNLAAFESGAYVWNRGSWLPFVNPIKQPGSLLDMLLSGMMTVKDAILLARLWFITQSEVDPMGTQETTQAFLNRWGFSTKFQSHFLQPFFGGIFLSAGLTPPASLFRYYMKQFLEGSAAMPAAGIGAIATQMVAKLPADAIRLGVEVTRVTSDSVQFSDGSSVAASRVILATDAASAGLLLGVSLEKGAFWGTKTFYFQAPALTERKYMLHLLPNSRVLHYAYLNHVQPAYAPVGKDLISVTSLDVTMKPEEVLQELAAFVGPEIKKWAFLKEYLLPEALPVVGAFELIKHKAEVAGILLAGDYTGFPSLQSALESGRKAAKACLSA
jgi:phytoene dehydrogenase-like protein